MLLRIAPRTRTHQAFANLATKHYCVETAGWPSASKATREGGRERGLRAFRKASLPRASAMLGKQTLCQLSYSRSEQRQL
jgi:hypothetical protein